MRKVLLTLGILALVCTPAMAGRNANGAMVVHTDDAYTYSAQTACTYLDALTDCEGLNTMVTRQTGAVVWCLAAFEASASPGVTVVYFGIDYDEVNLDVGVAYKFCGPAGSLEVPDDGWPYTGFGNSVAFGSAVYRNLFPFYVFKIDDYSGGVEGPYFGTAINPTGGYAAYVDDSNPPLLDECFKFGVARWYVGGDNDCPVPPVQGACCFPDGGCAFITREDCAAQGGVYQADGVLCDPNPCPVPGACCFENGDCAVLLEADCVAQGGQFYGGACDPNPCPQPPGACCDVDGNCTFVPADECAGEFLGVGILCDPNPCPVDPEGACCDEAGNCTITTEANCAGQWQGADTVCDPNPCEPVATESTTWGQIKANFR